MYCRSVLCEDGWFYGKYQWPRVIKVKLGEDQGWRTIRQGTEGEGPVSLDKAGRRETRRTETYAVDARNQTM